MHNFKHNNKLSSSKQRLRLLKLIHVLEFVQKSVTQ